MSLCADTIDLQVVTHVTQLLLLQLTKEDFPLPTFAPKLLAIGKEVNAGRGFTLVRLVSSFLCIQDLLLLCLLPHLVILPAQDLPTSPVPCIEALFNGCLS